MDEAPSLDSAEELICAVIRGEPAPWPSHETDVFAERVFERALYHGVAALLHECLKSEDVWPEEICARLRTRAVGHAMWELRHEQAIARAVDALRSAGLRPVLIKGSALAYSLYPNPVLRTRGDTDLVVASDHMQTADRVLTGIGFTRDLGVGAEVVSYHSSYSWSAPDITEHTIEVHSRIGISRLISNLLPYEELVEHAIPLPRLSDGALGHGAIDALFITCLHRATHRHKPYYAGGNVYYGANRLIWLYDLHLVSEHLSEPQWRQFLERAKKKGLITVSREGLFAARQCFHSSIPNFVLYELAKGDADDTVTRCINASHFGQQWLDFRTLSSLSEKVRFARELFLPPAAFMHSKYPQARLKWLPWLYTRRAIDVALKWMDKTYGLK